MEIDVTQFVRDNDAYEFSASVMERGQNADRDTWNNAKAEAESTPLLTDDQLDAFRDYTRGFGAWERDEIDAWTPTECNALFIQMISGDLRELESLATRDDGEIDWPKAEKLSSEGRIAGRMYPGDDGRIYYYVGD